MTARPRVLVPRDGTAGARWSDALVEAGLDPVLAPLITFGPPKDREPVRHALRLLRDGVFDWLLLTSERTVDALEVALEVNATPAGMRPRPRVTLAEAARGSRVAAVGPSTARRAEQAGLTVQHVPTTEHSARGMVTDLGPLGPATAFLPHSALARPELEHGLAAQGWDVTAVDAYQTLTADSLGAEAHDVDAVVLTSSSVATTWARLRTSAGPDPVVVCLGPRTAETAQSLGIRVADVAPDPSVPATVATLLAALAGATSRHAPESERQS